MKQWNITYWTKLNLKHVPFKSQHNTVRKQDSFSWIWLQRCLISLASYSNVCVLYFFIFIVVLLDICCRIKMLFTQNAPPAWCWCVSGILWGIYSLITCYSFTPAHRGLMAALPCLTIPFSEVSVWGFVATSVVERRTKSHKWLWTRMAGRADI